MHDLHNPYPYLASLRETSPVAQVADSSFYLVTSWDLVAEAVSRPADFSSNLTATMVWNPDGTVSAFPVAELGSPIHALATADDPAHRRHRTIVMPSLTAKSIHGLTPFITTRLSELWDKGLRDNTIDWVTAVAQRLPMAVVAEFVGLPTCDIDTLIRWAFGSTVLLDGVVSAENLSAAVESVGEMATYLADALAHEVRHPHDTAIGNLAQHVVAGAIDQDTAVMILIQLVTAGAESTVSLLGSSVWLLGHNPHVVAGLRADRRLVPRFVEEALRLESPFRGHYRHVTTDTTLGDVALQEGSHLYLSWAAANRDPARYEDPDTILLDSENRGNHMAFGKGLHLCVGAALARLEATTALNFLLDHTHSLVVGGDEPQWERSLLVRRLRSLEVSIQ
ncbi:cytochrome P450 [Gordonia sp. CPCC 205515]|uniref:cytochrome P450 n=1 Tax=Gordonia sp. CPCC 205515 TaxID=3140791 RepID=UPI003AF347D4